jgi:restriction endonuclease Mrr
LPAFAADAGAFATLGGQDVGVAGVGIAPAQILLQPADPANVHGQRTRVILIDGLALASLMVRYNVGVQDQQTYVIKRVDEDVFREG